MKNGNNSGADNWMHARTAAASEDEEEATKSAATMEKKGKAALCHRAINGLGKSARVSSSQLRLGNAAAALPLIAST